MRAFVCLYLACPSLILSLPVFIFLLLLFFLLFFFLLFSLLILLLKYVIKHLPNVFQCLKLFIFLPIFLLLLLLLPMPVMHTLAVQWRTVGCAC